MRVIRYLFFVLLFLSYVLQGVSASQDAIKQLEILLQKTDVTDQDKRAVERLLTGLSRMADGTSRQAAERFGYRWKIKLLESEGPRVTRDVAELQAREQGLRDLIVALGAQSVDEAKKKIAESKLSTDQKTEQITKNTQELGMIQQENANLKKNVEELKKSLEQEKKTKEEVQMQARQAEERATLSQVALNGGKKDLEETKAQLKTCQDSLAGRGELQQKLVQVQQQVEEHVKKVGEITQEKESFKIKFEQGQQQLIALTAEKEKALQQATQAEQRAIQCQSNVHANQQSAQTTSAALKKAQEELVAATNQLTQCRTDLAHQEELRQQLATVHRELENTKAGVVTSHAENVQLQQQIVQRQKTLDAALAEKEALSKNLQSKEGELVTCAGKLAHQQTLETQLNTLQIELQEEKTRSASVTNARAEVERQLALLSQESKKELAVLQQKLQAAQVSLTDCENIQKQIVQFERDLRQARDNAEATNKARVEAEQRISQLQIDLEKSKTAQQNAETELKNVKASAAKPIGFGGAGAFAKLPMASSDCDNKLKKIRQALSYYNRTKRGLFYKVDQLQGFIEQYIDPIAQGRALAQDIEDLIKSEQVQ